MARVSKAYAGMPGLASLVCTWVFAQVMMTLAALALAVDWRRFAVAFAVVFWLSYACWLVGNYAYVAATPDKRAGFGIGWSLSLTGEAGFLIALPVRPPARHPLPAPPARP